MRRKSKAVRCGNVTIGGGAPVSIQSMTNTDTRDVERTRSQIQALADAGCDIVRVSVYDESCVKAVRELVEASPVPLVADIHFDHKLAIGAIEQGIHKLRINPGNIGGEANVREVAACARAHHVPIRIGVNSGSVERDLLQKHGGPTPAALVESALSHAAMLENAGFDDIIIAVKASTIRDTVEANRLLASVCEYPLHLGLTEAGLPGRGTVKSTIAIGALLLDGIGDTIRVSLAGDPIVEPGAAKDILRALGLRGGVDIVACPTCGRTCIDVIGIAERIEAETKDDPTPLTIAIMGCVVNGPGEAREADIGIAGGKTGSVLFQKDKQPVKIEGDPVNALLNALHQFKGTAQ